jgi:dTDP-4-dehydrorhamnose reductase
MSGIFLVGRGHIGSILREELDDLITGSLVGGDMEDVGDDVVAGMKADMVVCTAGKTDLAWCQENPEEALRCNVRAPLNLFRKVHAAGKRFVHISSGCIWDGPYDENDKPFGPDDPPTPAAFYSWTKAACDALMLREARAGLLCILRPRQVYSAKEADRNTFTKLLRYDKLINTHNSMTSAYTLAKTIRYLRERNDAIARIMAVYDRGITTPHRVGMILAEMGLREPPEKTTKDELDSWLKPRRVDVVMSDPYFEKHIDPPQVEDEVRRVAALLGKD